MLDKDSPRGRRALACALPLAAALALAPSPAEAGGDDVYGNRGGLDMRELDHSIELNFERGYAELRVRRTVHNGIQRHDEAQFWINLPSTSVATGLRTLGELKGKPRWFAGDLMEAEAAAARYRELTGIGGYYPKDPALLSWRDQEFLALQVFPVAPQSDKTIEYTLSMPAVWHDGRWHLQLPELGTPDLAAELTLEPAEALDQLFVNGEVVARGHRLSLDQYTEIALAPRDPAPIQLSLASVDTGARHLAHWRVSVAPQLSEIPTRARVVVVLDGSRSLDDATLEAQRSAALAYLEHFLDPQLAAEVAVLRFDREVRPLTPGFVRAAEAREALRAASLVRRNGSELGLALAEAESLLGRGRHRGPKRVLLLSDFETAARLQPADLEALTGRSEAIIHLGVVEPSGSQVERHDGHPWSGVAAASEGVLWQIGAPDRWVDGDAYASAVFEELARPVRIDDLRVRVDDLRYEGVLDEGQGLDELTLSPTAAKALIVEGKTWNHPIAHRAKPDRREGDRWSALVFGSPLVYDLSEPEMMTLAMRGGAVSPVTSYLAIEPGVRPSTEGLSDEEAGGFGSGSAAGFSARGVRAPQVRMAKAAFDKQAWLEQELGAGWARCGGTGSTATLSLETQSTEILDLGLTVTGFGKDDAKLKACMEQVSWSLALHPRFVGFETWTVRVS